MELLDAYRSAEEKGILINGVNLENKRAFSLRINGIEGIGIDYSKIENTAAEKAVVMEELYHLHFGLLYAMQDTQNPCRKRNIECAEYRAGRQSAAAMIPFNELVKAVRHMKEIWELAEHFNVPEQSVKIAVEHYRAKGLLSF